MANDDDGDELFDELRNASPDYPKDKLTATRADYVNQIRIANRDYRRRILLLMAVVFVLCVCGLLLVLYEYGMIR